MFASWGFSSFLSILCLLSLIFLIYHHYSFFLFLFLFHFLVSLFLEASISCIHFEKVIYLMKLCMNIKFAFFYRCHIKNPNVEAVKVTESTTESNLYNSVQPIQSNPIQSELLLE